MPLDIFDDIFPSSQTHDIVFMLPPVVKIPNALTQYVNTNSTRVKNSNHMKKRDIFTALWYQIRVSGAFVKMPTFYYFIFRRFS